MFNTDAANRILTNLSTCYRAFMYSLNELDYRTCDEIIASISVEIFSTKNECVTGPDEPLNELYIIAKIPELFSSYYRYWKAVSEGKFSNSWNILQDCLSIIRSLRRYSPAQIQGLLNFFGHQLPELEKLYPYNVFFSIAATAESIECSICGKDIDSFECEHISGNLYRGEVAYGIVSGLGELNHISIVSNPADKRCTVQYEDSGKQFDVLRYLSNLITDKRMTPLEFYEAIISEKKVRNITYVKLSRNAECYCGSGKKFKLCCIDKEFETGHHIDIIVRKAISNEVSEGCSLELVPNNGQVPPPTGSSTRAGAAEQL